MKKIILIFAFIGFAIVSMAQSAPTQITPDGYITQPLYQYIFGTTADTMTNADTSTFVYRVKGNSTLDFNMQLYIDFVSGSSGGTVITYRSIDGNDYTATGVGDTITFSTITADALQSTVIDLDNFNFPYLKLIFIQAGTAVVVPRVYVYCKEN